MYRIHESEIPADKTVFQYFSSLPLFQEAMRDVKGKNDWFLPIPFRWDFERLCKEVEWLFMDPEMGWEQSPNSVTRARYKNIAIHMNGKTHSSELDPADRAQEFRYGMQDNLSFNKLALPDWCDELRALLNSFPAQAFKGRISRMIPPAPFELVMPHFDASLFEEVFVSITLISGPELFLHLKDELGLERKIELKDRISYTHNRQHLLHWETCINVHAERTSLSICLSPWIDFDEKNCEYFLNSSFGKLHPYDLALQVSTMTPQQCFSNEKEPQSNAPN